MLVRVPLKTMREVGFFPRADGSLDLPEPAPLIPNAATQWIGDVVEMYEGETRLGSPAVLATPNFPTESDRSFESWDGALAHVKGPGLPAELQMFWEQSMVDVLFAYPIDSERSAFSIDPHFNRLAARVTTALRFLPPGGAVRAYEFPDDPGLVLARPRWYQAAWRFLQLGIVHHLSGTDHLLFLLCLVIPFRKLRALIPVVTAFTLAHSITLIASAYDLAPNGLWFPPLIETLIAASIVYMALENIAGSGTMRRRWMITFAFGLVHGFGFSFALRETMQFGGRHLLASLLSFNVGVEIGQVAMLYVVDYALIRLVSFRNCGTHGDDYSFGSRRTYRMALDAGSGKRSGQIPIQMPPWDAALLASLLRWSIVVLGLWALWWFTQKP